MRNKYTHQHLQQLEEQENDVQGQRSKFLPMLCSSSSTKQVIQFSVSNRRCSSSASSPAVSEDPLSPRVGCMGQVKRNNKVVGFPTTRTFVGGFSSTTTSTATATATATATYSSGCTKTIIKSHDHVNNYGSNSIVKYHKLKRFFSTKTLTGSPTTAVARSGTHKAGKGAGRISSTHNNNNSNNRGMRADSAVSRDDHGLISRSKVDENCYGAIATDYNKKLNYENDKGSFVNLMDLDPPLPVMKELQQGNNGENVSLWKRRSKGAPLKSLQVQVTPQNCNLLLQPTTV